MLFTPYFSCPFCTFAPSIFVFMAVFFNFLYTYTKTKAHTVCGRAQASILLSFWRRLNDDMGEKVVRRKHLKTANQGVDGRFSRSFYFCFCFCFFTNRHNRVRNVIEKAITNQSFENNGMHIYLIYDQQFRNKGGKALTEEKKNDARFRHGVRKPCKLIEKVDRPANSRDTSPIATIWSIWRDNILQRSIPQNTGQAETATTLRLEKNVTLDMLRELYSIPHSLENIRKHKGEHSGH